MLSEIHSSIKRAYNYATIWGKVLVMLVVILLLIIAFKPYFGLHYIKTKEHFENENNKENNNEENNENNEENNEENINKSNKKTLTTITEYKYTFKHNGDIYDDFYANIYDNMFFHNIKLDHEIAEIENNTGMNSQSGCKILDIGCGIGHHVSRLSAKGYDVLGVDQSTAMIKKAKATYPTCDFEVVNILNNPTIFAPATFSQILCLYFTIYYVQDKPSFFKMCYEWLKPGGFLVIHLVNRVKFDPILPPAQKDFPISPQKLAKKRITQTIVKTDDFKYYADFQLNDVADTAHFVEKFKHNNGHIRKHKHVLYMQKMNVIESFATDAGFKFTGRYDMKDCGYEYQYLYFFTK